MVDYLDVVDEDDRVIGRETREKTHSSGLWHRGVHVLIFNSKERLILQMRSAIKDKCPNHYDCSVSEHVEEGEAYEDAAIRGLGEELGITDAKLKKILKFRMNYGPNDNMISELYECQHDGPVRIDKYETQSLECLSLHEIKEMLTKNEDKFASWTKEILKWYLKLPSRVEALFTG
jgi:isopentenyldiphosphate isomerase